MSLTDLASVFFERPDWWSRAACRGMSPTPEKAQRFFPTRGDTESVTEAKAVCERCPSIEPCREYALDNVIRNGVWGGMSERERRWERHQRMRERLGVSREVKPDSGPPSWIAPEYRGFYKKPRAPRRARFGCGGACCRSVARRLAQQEASA